MHNSQCTIKDKKIAQRMCIVCRCRGDKSDFIRIVKTPDGKIILSKSGKEEGRSAYICNLDSCKEKCVKTKAINRAFKQDAGTDIYEIVGATLCRPK